MFGQGRKTVAKGLGEKHTGIIYIGAQSVKSGRSRWEEREPEVADELRRLAESQSQQYPIFRSAVTYTRLTACSDLSALGKKEFADEPSEYYRSFIGCYF